MTRHVIRDGVGSDLHWGALEPTKLTTMKPTTEAITRPGTFVIKPIGAIPGTLTIDGRNTVLYLWSHQNFEVDPELNSTIAGILDDGRPVSLIRTVLTSHETNFTKHGLSQRIRLFPNYVVIGSDSVTDASASISSVSFEVTDAPTLFSDREAFGIVHTSKDLLTEIVKENEGDISYEIGDLPLVAYYTGKRELFHAECANFRVSGWHGIGWVASVAGGVRINSTPHIGVTFKDPVRVSEMTKSVNAVVQFLEAMVGSVQNVGEMHVTGPIGDEDHVVELHDNTRIRHEITRDVRGRIPFDDLIRPVQQRGDFVSVLTQWMSRDASWSDARWRVLTGWRPPIRYGPDRLIRAANAFDLVPTAGVDERRELPSAIAIVVQETRAKFRALDPSWERTQVLNALGRLKHLSLKNKVARRAEIVNGLIGGNLTDLVTVSNRAIDLRNVYVHGPSGRPSDEVLEQFVPFLTNTLEFIFVVSDLVECGWSFRDWYFGRRLRGHPFGLYIRDYAYWQRQLEAAVSTSR